MAKKTTSKKKAPVKASDNLDGVIKKHQKEISDYKKAIEQNNIDIKGYKDKVTELKKMIDNLNRTINTLEKKQAPKEKPVVMGYFTNEPQAQKYLDNACGGKDKFNFKIVQKAHNHYEIHRSPK